MTPMDPQDLSRQHAQLRRLARAIVGESYADDVVQDVWAAALVHSGPAPVNPDAWLNRVTRNLAWKSRLKEWRGRAREVDRASLGFDGSSDMDSPEALIVEVEEKHALERSVLELEEPYRSAVLWRYYGGLTVSEVASRTGQKASTTRTHLKRGLEQLRGRLEKEQGTEWRAALVPLLGRGLDLGGGAGAAAGAKSASLETVGNVSATGGSSVAGIAMALVKTGAAAAAAILLFLGGRMLFQPDATIETQPLQPVAVNDGSAAEPEERLAEVSMPVARSTEKVAEPIPAAIAAIVPAASTESEGTTIQVVEASSGKPLIGVVVDVEYAYMKKRGFFMTSTDSATETVTTDALGRAVIPVETDDEGQSASNSLRGSIRIGDQSGATVNLSAVAGKQNGMVELQLLDATALRVRLPEALTEEESAALAATVVVKRGPSVFADSRILQPVAADSRDLMFVIDRGINLGRSGQAETLHIATTVRGRTFHAEVPSKVSLASEPVHAVRANDVIHTYQVVDDVSGLPLEGQIVSVGRPTERLPYASREALGITGEDGAVRLIGIPPGEVTMFVRAEGYEEFRTKAAVSAGGTTEVRLVPKAGLRSVALTVDGPGEAVPRRVVVDVITNDALSSAVSSLSLSPVAKPGGGWAASGVLEKVPGQVCFLEASTSPANHDLVGPVRIEPGQSKVEVAFGPFHKRTNVRLRLPPFVEVEFQHRAGEGRLYGSHGPHSNGGVVGTVEDDGRPVTWLVTSPGYVPVVGNEADWRRVNEGEKEFIEITPELRPGWGAIVRVDHMEWDKTVPFQFRTEQPIAGVTIFDCASGQTLGVTDEYGLVVITAAKQVDKVGARYGDETKTLSLKGAAGAHFGF